MVRDMEEAGRIEPGQDHLIEPTSGNTGIALAFVGGRHAAIALIVVMPESMSHRAAQDAGLLGAESN